MGENLVALANIVKLSVQLNPNSVESDGNAHSWREISFALNNLKDGLEGFCGSCGAKLDHSSYQQIFQACHLIFSKVLPQLAGYESDVVTSQLADENCNIKILSCEILSWLSRIHPDEIVSCWPLFLTDTFSEEKLLEQLYNEVMSKICVVTEKSFEQLNSTWTPSAPILAMMCSNCEQIQISAIKCIDTMVNSRSLHRWMRMSMKRGMVATGQTSKIFRYLTKLLKIMTVMLVDCRKHGTTRVTKCILEMYTGVQSALNIDLLHLFPKLDELCQNFIGAVARVSIGANFGIGREQAVSLRKYPHTTFEIQLKSDECLQWLCVSAKSNANQLIVQHLVNLSFYYKSSLREEKVFFTVWLIATFSASCLKKLKLQDSLIHICAALLAKFVTTSDHSKYVSMPALFLSNLSGERLLCAKTFSNYISTNGHIPSQWLEMLFQLMMDDNHLVRIASLEAMANMKNYHWNVCSDGDQKIFSVINSLFALMIDQKGTVRGAAFKAFGEMICALKNLPHNNDWLPHIIKGCQDTKLAVRIQAMWSLSKLFELKILPSSFQQASSFDHIQWLHIMQICCNSLQESEKIQATAIRCLSWVLASTMAIFSDTSPHRIEATRTIGKTLELVVEKFFPPWDRDNFVDQIVHKAHKLVCALADLFGCACFICFEHNIVLPACDIIKLLVGIFRYGGLQPRLTSLRTLVALIFHPRQVSFEAVDAEWFLREVLLILENERVSILKTSSLKTSQDPIEHLQAIRRKELRRTLVMSLLGVFHLNVVPEHTVMELVGQHIDVVLSLLEVISSDEVCEIGQSGSCLLHVVLLHKNADQELRHKEAMVDLVKLLSNLMEKFNLGTIQQFRLQNLLQHEESFVPVIEYRHFEINSSLPDKAFREHCTTEVSYHADIMSAAEEDEI